MKITKEYIKELLEELDYKVWRKLYELQCNIELAISILEQVYFMWTTESGRTWGYYFLLPLLEYRLIKIKEAMFEENEIGHKTISECLDAYKVYKNPSAGLTEPACMAGDWFRNDLSDKEHDSIMKYINKKRKIEKSALKKFFKIMSDNIETWDV